MAYPTSGDIIAAAQQFGVHPLLVYAFAATEQRLPAIREDLTNYQSRASALAMQLNAFDSVYVLDYAQSRGAMPPSQTALHEHMRGAGALDARGFVPGWVATPGRGYPPGALAATLPAGSGDVLGGLQRFWQGGTVNKVLLIGGGYLLLKTVGRGRL